MKAANGTRQSSVARSLCPKAAYVEVEGAGHMAPVMHTDVVNKTFISAM